MTRTSSTRTPRIFSQIMLVATFAVASSLSLAGGYGKYGMKSKDNGKDIVTTAVEAGQFNTLAAALKAADLVGTLQGDGPFTVFAPTDAAFEKLPAGTVEKLLMPENRDQLISILTYHVVAGKVDSGQVVNLSSAKTVNGKELKIDTATGSVRVDNATVVKADIMASNGIIHVIDTVVIPAS